MPNDSEDPPLGDFEVSDDYPYFDALTGLVTRRATAEILAGPMCSGPTAVFHVDIEGLKAVNDGYGHEFGDQVLIEVAALIGAATPDFGIATRVGGDEFAVVLPDVHNTEVLKATAVALLDSCNSSSYVSKELIGRFSIGVAVIDGRDLTLAIVIAERAGAEARRRGGNVAVCLNPLWEVP